jgi:hypothetical protein
VGCALERIAVEQERGNPLSSGDLAFINRAISEETHKNSSCGGGSETILRGWFVELFYDGEPMTFKPTIADVHTQPTDLAGNPVGLVLHVGTAHPRMIVVNVDVGGRPRTFTGVVSSYREVTTRNLERLTDGVWQQTLEGYLRGLPPDSGNRHDVPPEVSWMQDLVLGRNGR